MNVLTEVTTPNVWNCRGCSFSSSKFWIGTHPLFRISRAKSITLLLLVCTHVITRQCWCTKQSKMSLAFCKIIEPNSQIGFVSCYSVQQYGRQWRQVPKASLPRALKRTPLRRGLNRNQQIVCLFMKSATTVRSCHKHLITFLKIIKQPYKSTNKIWLPRFFNLSNRC